MSIKTRKKKGKPKNALKQPAHSKGQMNVTRVYSESVFRGGQRRKVI